MLALKVWTPVVGGASPLVLSLDSGRAMFGARHIETSCAIKFDDRGEMGLDCCGSNHNELGW